MTLADYSTYICSRLNQSDAITVGLCKQFVQRRYQMIWDARNWRDALKNVAASLTDTVNGLLAFPAGIDRIVAIRGNGNHILVPIDSPQAMQLSPTVFEQMDDPMAYEEFTDDSKARMIRFLPIPKITTPLLIVGKRLLVNLENDTDVPLLRGIDNAIISFATADMLERQRQYGKAQAKVQEASAMLQEMIDVETKQSGNMPRVIPAVDPWPLGWGFESWDVWTAKET